MNIKTLEKKTRAYTLKNALAHDGTAMQGPVISSLFVEGLKKSDMGKYGKKINEIIMEVNDLSKEEQKKEFEKLEKQVHKREVKEGLEELPNVGKKGVVMRFSPSPSGAFHIGHAMTFSINFIYVRKYGGTMYLRIEDTNPENIYPKAYDLLKKDAAWLSKGKIKFVIQSERMDLYYKYAEKLIKKKSAYVCVCDADKFKEYVKQKKNCGCRNNSVKKNMGLWGRMLTPQAYPDKSSKKISTRGKEGFAEGEAVLRFKSDMKDKNPAMRDFPLARINLTEHPIQKKKYRVWPLMNLAVAVDDIEMKMTHIIRAKEHRDNAQRQRMIFEVLGKKYPWGAYLGRWHIKGMRLSATQITKDIEAGKYSGWDDPELPTIQALMKKGYKPEAFWKFAEQRGLSEVDKVIDKKDFFEVLDRFNSE